MGEARRRKLLGIGPRPHHGPPPARIVKVGEREHNLSLAYPGCNDCLGTGVARVLLRQDEAGKTHRINQICRCVLLQEDRLEKLKEATA